MGLSARMMGEGGPRARYAALFREINVGGRRPVAMADLRAMFVDCGFARVKTHIQSGNVVFDFCGDAGALAARISRAFADRFGFEGHAAVFSAAALTALVRALPFSRALIDRVQAGAPDVAHVYYYLSPQALDPAAVDAICRGYDGEDRLALGERVIYLLCAQSVRDSALAVRLAKLDPPLTARNDKTMQRLCHMLADDP